MSKIKNSLAESEYRLILETEEGRIVDLPEGKLLKLHKRTRRARNKYVKDYRRQGAQKVGKKGGRGLAKKVNVRRAERAELFEEALSRVSRRLAVVAHESAERIKAERLAAAQTKGSGPKTSTAADGKVKSKGKSAGGSNPRVPRSHQGRGIVTVPVRPPTGQARQPITAKPIAATIGVDGRWSLLVAVDVHVAVHAVETMLHR